MTLKELQKLAGPKAIQDSIDMIRSCSHQVTEWRVDQVSLGAAMRQLRKDSGMTMREVARRMNLSAAFLSDCEYGNRKMSPGYLAIFIKFCKEAK